MAAKDAVARIRQDEEFEEAAPEEVEDTDIDIDLDEIDDQLRREAIGKATTVRIDGNVIHVEPAGDWSSTAMRAMTSGDWDTWAREVIMDDKEFQAWSDADLRNYQMEAIVSECAKKARLSSGKSRRRSGSSRNGRKR